MRRKVDNIKSQRTSLVMQTQIPDLRNDCTLAINSTGSKQTGGCLIVQNQRENK